jgi:hypothetical protein
MAEAEIHTYYTASEFKRHFKVQYLLLPGDDRFLVRVWRAPAADNDPPLLRFAADEVFVGESRAGPVTRYSNAIGPEFSGNTLLFKTHGHPIYIGDRVLAFYAPSAIIRYESPVGIRRRVFPYARDINGDTYLFTEAVIVLGIEEFDEDPYRTYRYRCRIVTQDLSRRGFLGLEAFGVGDQYLDLLWSPLPEVTYERWAKLGEPWVLVEGQRMSFTYEDYLELLRFAAPGMCRLLYAAAPGS